MLAPAKTPASIVAKLSADANKVLADPDVKQKMQIVGAEPSGDTPGEFASFIRDDQAQWSKLMKERGIAAQ